MSNSYALLHSKVRRHPIVEEEIKWVLQHGGTGVILSTSDLESLIVKVTDSTLNLLKADIDMRKELLDG